VNKTNASRNINQPAAALGLSVYTTNHQNPGRRYQIGRTNAAGAFFVLSANYLAKDAAAWLDGYRAALEDRSALVQLPSRGTESAAWRAGYGQGACSRGADFYRNSIAAEIA